MVISYDESRDAAERAQAHLKAGLVGFKAVLTLADPGCVHLLIISQSRPVADRPCSEKGDPGPQ